MVARQMTSQAQQVSSFRELWSGIVRYLRANLTRAIVMSVLSFVAGWLLNIYVMAVRYEGSVIGPGGTATSPGNVVQGGMYWGVLSTVVFSLLAYGHQAGWGKLRDDLLSLPGILRNTFASPAAGAWSMLLWGAAISLAAGALIGPAVAGILGAGLLLMAPSPISGILGRLITRLWLGVLGVVSPANKQRVGGIGGTIASVAGTALGMVLAWRTGSDSTKVVLAVVAAAAAFLIATRKATPQGIAGLFLLLGGLVALRRIFEGVAFADDGGWSECGDCTLIDWSRSAGADDVIRSGAAGGTASGVGAALGTGLGGAVADLGGGGDVPPRPDDAPPGGDDLPDRPSELPPIIDEHGEVMEVSDGSQVDAAGNPIPPGLVRWDVPGEETRWVARDEAIDLVQETRDAAASQAQFDREVTAHADAWEAESRERTAAQRTRDEAEAAERIAEREGLEEWGRRIEEEYDDRIERQAELERRSTELNSDEGWWDQFYDEYQQGVKDDINALPGQAYDAFGNAVRRVAEELSDGENWRVLGETLWDTAIDGARVVAGDPEAVRETAETIRSAIEKTGEVAGTIYAAAENQTVGENVAAVARVLLGADNWEAATDKETPVLERLGRSIWGVIDTGGVLLSGGAAAVGAVDKVGDMLRAGDVASDALRATDAAADALRATDAAGDAARAADASRDAARLGLPDEMRHVDDLAEDGLRAQRGTTHREIGPRQRTPYQDPDATAAARARLNTPLDELSDAERAAEAARRRQQLLDSRAAGTTPDDYIHGLPEGAMVDPNLIHHTGYTADQLDGLRRVAQEHNVTSGTRLTNMDSMRHVRDGTGIPKPLDVKSKTIGQLDVYLGANEADRGLVGLFQPQRTPDEAYRAAVESLEAAGQPIPPNLRSQIQDRWTLRNGEIESTNFASLRERGISVDTSRGVVTNADGVPFAGDIDPVFFRDATTGQYLSGDEYLKVMETFKRSGVQGQHGAEVNLLGDLTRGMEPGSPEWHEAYNNAVKLQDKLGATHTSGSELVVEMGPDGILRRGTHMGGGLPDVEGVRATAASLAGGGA